MKRFHAMLVGFFTTALLLGGAFLIPSASAGLNLQGGGVNILPGGYNATNYSQIQSCTRMLRFLNSGYTFFNWYGRAVNPSFCQSILQGVPNMPPSTPPVNPTAPTAHTALNVPAGATLVLSGTLTDVSVEPQTGVEPVDFRDNASGKVVARFDYDFDNPADLADVTFGVDVANGKAFFHDGKGNIGSATTPYMLIVPKVADHNALDVCIGADGIDCDDTMASYFRIDDGGQVLEPAGATAPVTVQVVGQNWLVSDTTGTSANGVIVSHASHHAPGLLGHAECFEDTAAASPLNKIWSNPDSAEVGITANGDSCVVLDEFTLHSRGISYSLRNRSGGPLVIENSVKQALPAHLGVSGVNNGISLNISPSHRWRGSDTIIFNTGVFPTVVDTPFHIYYQDGRPVTSTTAIQITIRKTDGLGQRDPIKINMAGQQEQTDRFYAVIPDNNFSTTMEVHLRSDWRTPLVFYPGTHHEPSTNGLGIRIRARSNRLNTYSVRVGMPAGAVSQPPFVAAPGILGHSECMENDPSAAGYIDFSAALQRGQLVNGALAPLGQNPTYTPTPIELGRTRMGEPCMVYDGIQYGSDLVLMASRIPHSNPSQGSVGVLQPAGYISDLYDHTNGLLFIHMEYVQATSPSVLPIRLSGVGSGSGSAVDLPLRVYFQNPPLQGILGHSECFENDPSAASYINFSAALQKGQLVNGTLVPLGQNPSYTPTPFELGRTRSGEPCTVYDGVQHGADLVLMANRVPPRNPSQGILTTSPRPAGYVSDLFDPTNGMLFVHLEYVQTTSPSVLPIRLSGVGSGSGPVVDLPLQVYFQNPPLQGILGHSECFENDPAQPGYVDFHFDVEQASGSLSSSLSYAPYQAGRTSRDEFCLVHDGVVHGTQSVFRFSQNQLGEHPMLDSPGSLPAAITATRQSTRLSPLEIETSYQQTSSPSTFRMTPFNFSSMPVHVYFQNSQPGSVGLYGHPDCIENNPAATGFVPFPFGVEQSSDGSFDSYQIGRTTADELCLVHVKSVHGIQSVFEFSQHQHGEHPTVDHGTLPAGITMVRQSSRLSPLEIETSYLQQSGASSFSITPYFGSSTPVHVYFLEQPVSGTYQPVSGAITTGSAYVHGHSECVRNISGTAGYVYLRDVTTSVTPAGGSVTAYEVGRTRTHQMCLVHVESLHGARADFELNVPSSVGLSSIDFLADRTVSPGLISVNASQLSATIDSPYFRTSTPSTLQFELSTTTGSTFLFPVHIYYIDQSPAVGTYAPGPPAAPGGNIILHLETARHGGAVLNTVNLSENIYTSRGRLTRTDLSDPGARYFLGDSLTIPLTALEYFYQAPSVREVFNGGNFSLSGSGFELIFGNATPRPSNYLRFGSLYLDPGTVVQPFGIEVPPKSNLQATATHLLINHIEYPLGVILETTGGTTVNTSSSTGTQPVLGFTLAQGVRSPASRHNCAINLTFGTALNVPEETQYMEYVGGSGGDNENPCAVSGSNPTLIGLQTGFSGSLTVPAGVTLPAQMTVSAVGTNIQISAPAADLSQPLDYVVIPIEVNLSSGTTRTESFYFFY